MKFGTYEIEKILHQNLQGVEIRGIRKGKFVKDSAKLIMELFEAEMANMKDWNVVHDFPEHLEKIARRLEKGLGLNLMKRDGQAQKVYEFILEQEAQGRKLETWMEWATNEERLKYVGKYRHNVENIMADYPQAWIGDVRPTKKYKVNI